jgi:hypothetical protein
LRYYRCAAGRSYKEELIDKWRKCVVMKKMMMSQRNDTGKHFRETLTDIV